MGIEDEDLDMDRGELVATLADLELRGWLETSRVRRNGPPPVLLRVRGAWSRT